MELNTDSYSDDALLTQRSENNNPILHNVRVENNGSMQTVQRKKQLTIAITVRMVILLVMGAVVWLAVQYIQTQKKRLEQSIQQLDIDTNNIRNELQSMQQDDPIAAESWHTLNDKQRLFTDLTVEQIQKNFDRILNKFNIKEYQLNLTEFILDNSLSGLKNKQTEVKQSKISLSFNLLDDTIIYELVDELSNLDNRLPGVLILLKFSLNRTHGTLRYYDEVRISEGNFKDYSLQINLEFIWYNIWEKKK